MKSETLAQVALNNKDMKLFLKGKTKDPELHNIRILTIVKSAGDTITYKQAKRFLKNEGEFIQKFK